MIKIKSLSRLSLSTGGILSLAFAGLYLSGWKPLKIQGIGGGHEYGDLASVSHAASCYREIGAQVFTDKGSCGYQYGLFLLKLINFLRLNSLTPFALGGIFFIVVALLLVALGMRAAISRKHQYLVALVLLSPGPWLLFERGNFDLLIIIFLTITIFTLNTRISFVGAVLLLATALMKFYTFPLLLLYVLIEKNKWLKIVVSVASIAIIPPIASDIISAPGHPNPMYVAFGLTIPGLWVNFFAWRFNVDLVLGMIPLYLIGVVVFASAFVYYHTSTRTSTFKAKINNLSFSSDLEKNVFLFSSLTYVSCFLAGSNFDYRLIYLAIALVIINKSLPESTNLKLLIFLELSSLWFTYFYFGAIGAIPVLLSITGNAAQLALAVVLATEISKICHSELSLGLSNRFGFRSQSARSK